ncbi:acyltransferase [Frigoribacterium sp. ACAM 257]|uniref:acyltransferase family protein n=1 Tax=Frigoribacterium sp. ACAM 257 TaxID=2508998 RepID=UPI0011B9F298|nr:acyltransferase family protein [Frigoribacterium sp. ACAM 257]TWX40254.1 acyltransferase [Frigoribacterium sp. ACAM 257]
MNVNQNSRVARADIQALRALAVMLVVAYHLYPNRLPGGYVGVDVFFVISGFLITAHLRRELENTGKVHLGRFYVRRVRRLLPAAGLVLAVTGLGTLLFAPHTVWAATGRQLLASAFYVENWALAANSVDYSAAAADASPVQHFWSLSVEEQFYLVWPVLLLGIFVISRRRRRPGAWLCGGLVVVALASLVVSIAMTGYDAGVAYFITPTRVWEFAVGGLLTFLRARPVRSAVPESTVRWAGVAAMTAGALAFSAATPFPGWFALLPVGGAALFLLAPLVRAEGATPVVVWAPLSWLGDISYSLYLWHWPLIVLLPFVTGEALTTGNKAFILCASIVAAAVTKTFVEDRFRGGAPAVRHHARTPRTVAGPAIRTVVAVSVVVAIPAAFLIAVPHYETAAATRELDALAGEFPPGFGAAASSQGDFAGPEDLADVVPDPLIAKSDNWTASEDTEGCQQRLGPFTEVTSCSFGSDDADAEQVVLVGDSHAGQWEPALARLADREGWALTTMVRSSCPLSSVSTAGADENGNACPKWNDAVMQILEQTRPDVVVVSAVTGATWRASAGETNDAAASRGFAGDWSRLESLGTDVVAIRDNPNPIEAGIPDMETCVANATATSECDLPRDDALLTDPQVAAAAASGADLIDLTPYFCDDETCPSVIGGVMVYQDRQHVTATFVETLTPFVAGQLLPVTEAAE